jgi:hypothetical protein
MIVCGSTIENGAGPTALTDCDMTCAGNSSEYCGGPDRLNLYNYTSTATTTTTTGAQPPSGPIAVPSFGNWTSLGCYRWAMHMLQVFIDTSNYLFVAIPLPLELCHTALALPEALPSRAALLRVSVLGTHWQAWNTLINAVSTVILVGIRRANPES